MLPTEPIAYLLTWTVKGTHFHGEAGGSVDRHHNQFGTPRLEADPSRVSMERQAVRGTPGPLTPDDRQLIESTIRDVARHRLSTVHALAVRTTHVHVVLEAGGRRPEALLNTLKAWTTRRMRESGRLGRSEYLWTRHGSTRYLWREADVAAAVRYVEEAQDVGRE